MNIVNISVPAGVASPVSGCGPIPIGYVGENGVTQVQLDFSAWKEAYGEGQVGLEIMRNGDTIPYMAVLQIDGTTAIWTVTDVDTGAKGVGVAGYTYTIGDNLKRSAVFPFFVGRDVNGDPGARPEPYESFIDQMRRILADSQAAQAAAEAAQAAAETAEGNAETAQAAAESARDTASERAEDAETAKNSAEAARDAIENMSVDAHALTGSSEPTIDKTVDPQTGAVALDFGIPTPPVASVNGKTGAVVLDAEDVGALPDDTTLDDIPNGATFARATPEQLGQIATNTGDIAALQGDVDDIEAKVPNQASAQNQLADKAFVNSSINSAAAFFRGSFPTRAALLAVAWQTSDAAAPNYVTNNDYAYVEADESHDDEAWRYIYVLQPGGQNNGWQPQFKVNDTPLTAAQLAALNSGATSELIDQITANETAIQGKQNKINGTGLLKGQGNGSVVPAEAGTDYLAPSALSLYRTAAAQDEIDQQQDAAIAGKYTLPAEGIPKTDLAESAQDSLDLADVTYEAAAAAGSVVTFSAPGVLPLKSLGANIEPVQAGSGDPSPNNVRAITGWTGANIVISPTQLAADGSTISVTFPAEAGTVYGGTLDLLNGILTVDRIGKKIKDLSWSYSSNYQRFEARSPSPAAKPAEAQTRPLAGLICECYKTTAVSAEGNPPFDEYCIGITNSGIILIKNAVDPATYTDVNAFVAAMGEYLIVYPLNEPIAYPIGQRAVATLLGTNNIWADTGDVSVTYGAYVEAANDHTDRVEARLPKEVKTTITLDTSWSGSSPTFTQAVTVSGYTLTPRSKIDLQPDDTVILQLAADNVISLFVTNNNGTLTACAVGAAPTAALSIQCTIKEVDV